VQVVDNQADAGAGGEKPLIREYGATGGPETGGERRPDGASSCVELVERLTAEVKFLHEHSLQLKNALTKEEIF